MVENDFSFGYSYHDMDRWNLISTELRKLAGTISQLEFQSLHEFLEKYSKKMLGNRFYPVKLASSHTPRYWAMPNGKLVSVPSGDDHDKAALDLVAAEYPNKLLELGNHSAALGAFLVAMGWAKVSRVSNSVLIYVAALNTRAYSQTETILEHLPGAKKLVLEDLSRRYITCSVEQFYDRNFRIDHSFRVTNV